MSKLSDWFNLHAPKAAFAYRFVMNLIRPGRSLKLSGGSRLPKDQDGPVGHVEPFLEHESNHYLPDAIMKQKSDGSWEAIRNPSKHDWEEFQKEIHERSARLNAPKPLPILTEQGLRDEFMKNVIKLAKTCRSEGAPNRGPVIDEVNRAANQPMGSAYATSAILVALDEACRTYGITNPYGIQNQAWQLFNMTPNGFRRFGLIKVGDLALFARPTDSNMTTFSVGVIAPTPQGAYKPEATEFASLEFNSSIDGGLNGDRANVIQRSLTNSDPRFRCIVDVVGFAMDFHKEKKA